jgi:hypothetical protein
MSSASVFEASESSIEFLITASKLLKCFGRRRRARLHRSRDENAWRRRQRQAREPDCYLSLSGWVHKLHTGIITRVEQPL